MHWSTATVEVKHRLDYWVGAICECFLEMEATSSQAMHFDCELSSTPLHRLRINRVQGSAQEVYRTRGSIARGSENFYYLLCKERTPCTIEQQGLHADRLLPGDLALIDSRTSYALHFPDTVDTWSVQLPIQWLEGWLPAPRRELGRRIDASHGWGAALSAYVRAFAVPNGALPQEVMADHLGAMLASALSAAPAPTPASRDLAARIDDCVASRCTEPALCAQDIAATLQVSVRTLHRALAAAQRSFAVRLMHHRMALARRMLESPAFDKVATGEVGWRVGFSDPSHFVRVCRRWLGCTPLELRARRGIVQASEISADTSSSGADRKGE